MKLKIFSAVVLLLVCIQFIHLQPNDSKDDTHAIWNTYQTPDRVKSHLQAACLDCHSNFTRETWYSNIQPLGFWLQNHVREGKKHVNYSEFTNRPLARQYHKLEETIEMINEGEMPLSSYTFFGLHSEANLTAENKKEIIHWAQSIMDTMKAHYPPDSFVMKKKKD